MKKNTLIKNSYFVINCIGMSSLIRLQLLWTPSNYKTTFPGLRVFKIHLLKACCGIINTLIWFYCIYARLYKV